MNHHYFGAPSRTAFQSVFRTGRARIVFGVALIGLGLIGGTAASLASYEPAGAAASSACRPNRAFSLPQAIVLTPKNVSLTYHDDGDFYYYVGGANVQEVRDALNRCAPRLGGTGDYLAYTNYALSWSYDINANAQSVCTLADVKVGLRVNQLLPALLNQSRASTPVQSKWNAFMAGLRTHEAGHLSVDRSQADSLLRNLRHLSAPCSRIAASARSITTASTKALITANTAHDTQTDYGRDQGALF